MWRPRGSFASRLRPVFSAARTGRGHVDALIHSATNRRPRVIFATHGVLGDDRTLQVAQGVGGGALSRAPQRSAPRRTYETAAILVGHFDVCALHLLP